MRVPILLTSILLATVLLPAVAPAQGRKDRKAAKAAKQAPNPEGPVDVDLGQAKLGATLAAAAAGDAGKQSDWPAVAVGSDGSVWMIYVEWNDKDADRVLVRKRSPEGRWSAAVPIEDGNWDHYAPAIVARASGALAVWSGQSAGNYDLFAAEISSDGRPAKPVRLTTAPWSDFNVRAAADAKGNVTIVWQSFRNGNADVYARRLTGGKWGPEVKISDSPASDWDPAVALDSRGVAWISWDSYHCGNYDVFLRSFDGRKPGQLIQVTSEPAAQFHTSVAVDPKGMVWVAWDEGGINWGKDFSRASSVEGSRGLHYERTLGLRVWANGRVQSPRADLKKILTGRMTRYAELPQLMLDAGGTLWMVFRHWTSTKPNEIYHFYATSLSGSEWSLPRQFESSAGHNSQLAGLARDSKGGIAVAYSSDLRSATNLPASQMHALHYNVFLASLPSGTAPVKLEMDPVAVAPEAPRFARRVRETMTVGGKKYTLLLGDCHRHTDIRGHSSVDGSVLDTYRYAIDAAQLDFLGVSDHNEAVGGRWPDGLRDYQWWWVQKAVDLFTHAPNFIGVYSYEHSMARPGGHRNVLFLKRGAPLRPIDRDRKPEDNLPPNMWKWWEENVLSQKGQRSVIVPHTFAAGPLADWNWPNARFDCLLEMYQGCRGSYEAYKLPAKEKRGPTQVDEGGHYAQDALAKGNVYGFVSFSDHGSTHNSWAGAWALTEDREGLLDAMYMRRTSAASDEIILKVTAGGRMVGEEWEAGAAPRIEAAISAPDTILRVDVVKDGKYVYTINPNARSATLSWQDREAKPGKSYYYVRAFQRDPENPDGDPEIGWASPFYVTVK